MTETWKNPPFDKVLQQIALLTRHLSLLILISHTFRVEGEGELLQLSSLAFSAPPVVQQRKRDDRI